MNKKVFVAMLLFCILFFHNYSEAKSIIFFGDSRAAELAERETTAQSVSKAKTTWGQQIIKDGEIDWAGPGGFEGWNWGGSTTNFWLPFIALSPYSYDITVISLGGNDILDAYKQLEFIQNIVWWIRAFSNPFGWLTLLFQQKMTAMDELFWLWHMQAVTDRAAYNYSLIANMILLKNPNNKVIVNDVAPVLKPHISGNVWDGWDFRAFLRVNLYISIYNNKLLSYATANPFNLSRVRFLWTSPSFWNNLTNYYMFDGIHFNSAGLNNWSTLIALNCVNANWLESYSGSTLPAPTDPTDVNPPEFVSTPAGSWDSGILLWGYQESPALPLDIQITDDKGIAGVIGLDLADITGYGGAPRPGNQLHCEIPS